MEQRKMSEEKKAKKRMGAFPGASRPVPRLQERLPMLRARTERIFSFSDAAKGSRVTKMAIRYAGLSTEVARQEVITGEYLDEKKGGEHR